MPQTIKRFASFIEKRLSEVSEDRKKYQADASMIPRIYGSPIQTSQAWEEYSSVGQVPNVVAFEGRLTAGEVFPGYSTRIEPNQFGLYLEHDRSFVDTIRFGSQSAAKGKMAVLESFEQGLIDSNARVKEKNAAKVIANSTSAAYDFITLQEEGASLANTAHKTRYNVSTASGFSNLGTSVMNPVATHATIINMMRLKSPIGEIWNTSRKFAIICGTTNSFRARQIVETTKGVSIDNNYSADHIKNVQQGLFDIIVWNYLDDYSTSAWGIVDVDMMLKNMIHLTQVTAETEREVDFMTKSIRQSIYDSHGFGHTDWRHFYWHKP